MSETPKRKPAPKGRIKGHGEQAIAVLDPLVLPDPMARTRCTARSKQSGQQCKQQAIAGGRVCRFHGGAAPQVQFKALERLIALQAPAVDTLEELMAMRREYPSTGYAAARDVLDRTIGKAAEVVRQEHSGQITIVHELDHEN